MFLIHDGWGMLRHHGGQHLGAGSQSLGSWCEPRETALQTLVAPSPDRLRSQLRPRGGPRFWPEGDPDARPGCVVHLLCGLGRRWRGSDLASQGPLRTLGCSINTRGSCQGPGEFLKTAVGWDKALHTLSVKGCVLVC